MKSYLIKCLLLFITVATTPLITRACDICGCGVGNNYIGILPDFHKHIFGIRYRFNSMLTHVGVNGNFTYLTTDETYHTLEAWGGWNIGKHFRMMASLPYSVNERTNQGISNSKSGLGDVVISGYFQLLNKRKTVFGNKILIQNLWVGAGTKLATGRYNPSDKNAGSDNANLFQLGTGSNDFIMGFMYDMRLQDMGINLTSNYKITNANQYHYQYGDKFNVNLQAYYKIRINNLLTIAPNTGLQYENTQTDRDNGFTVTVSGGNLLLGTAGAEISFSKIAIGANIQTPLSQNLANGIVKANNRMMLHISLAL
jgi:hypothetical protein